MEFKRLSGRNLRERKKMNLINIQNRVTWYFLFAYAILRSIPRKLGGVMALVLSVVILAIMPFYGRIKFKSRAFLPLSKIGFWSMVVVVLLLT